MPVPPSTPSSEGKQRYDGGKVPGRMCLNGFAWFRNACLECWRMLPDA